MAHCMIRTLWHCISISLFQLGHNKIRILLEVEKEVHCVSFLEHLFTRVVWNNFYNKSSSVKTGPIPSAIKKKSPFNSQRETLHGKKCCAFPNTMSNVTMLKPVCFEVIFNIHQKQGWKNFLLKVLHAIISAWHGSHLTMLWRITAVTISRVNFTSWHMLDLLRELLIWCQLVARWWGIQIPRSQGLKMNIEMFRRRKWQGQQWLICSMNPCHSYMNATKPDTMSLP